MGLGGIGRLGIGMGGARYEYYVRLDEMGEVCEGFTCGWDGLSLAWNLRYGKLAED